MYNDYKEEVEVKCTLKLRELLRELPPFLSDFFRGIADTTAPRTKISYARDFKLFFEFLTNETKLLKGRDITSITTEDLDSITSDVIESFMEYLSYYEKDKCGVTTGIQNGERGKSRKLAAIRTMFSYFYKKRRIDSNPADLVDFPKLHEKMITRLQADEVARLLDEIESGNKLTTRQQAYHGITARRDLAIVTLLLGTGIRVSECVGIDLDHLDFDINGVKVIRKGGNESIIYFGEEVEEALLDYIKERKQLTPKLGHENALFLSIQNRRITDRGIQLLVKKYSKIATPLKKISPHKLRSTYGTNLYQESGDIYLVADVLGHSDVNTTRKHYAKMEEERRRKAVNYVKLRKD